MKVRVLFLIGMSFITLSVGMAAAGADPLTAARLEQLHVGAGSHPPGLPSASEGSGFTYQGRLTTSGNPANGQFDLAFALYDAPLGGNPVATPVTLTNQTVTDGLFTVTLDFGAAFQGDARYLEVAVQPGGGGGFTTLSPRQPLTPAPYAVSLVPGATINGATSSPLLSLNNNGSGNGIQVTSNSGTGVYGTSNGYSPGVEGSSHDGTGVYGVSANGTGVQASSSGSSPALFANNTGSGAGVMANSSGGPGVQAQSNGGQPGVYGYNGSSGDGVFGSSNTGVGVQAFTLSGFAALFAYNNSSSTGIEGESNGGIGVYGGSTSGVGAQGVTSSTVSGIAAVYGDNSGVGPGVKGLSARGPGVQGQATTAQPGVSGSNTSTGPGVSGTSSNGDGVQGNTSDSNHSGVFGINSGAGKGVFGSSSSGHAVEGSSTSGVGVYGSTGSGTNAGVYGNNTGAGPGVQGQSTGGNGVNAFSSTSGASGIFADNETSGGYGIYAKNHNPSGFAGYFDGNVAIQGNLSVSGSVSKGSGSFKIDDPLDPANKYLYHSFVESPDMMDVYNGNVTLDQSGEGTVTMPDYFQALNMDFRYQLTPIGAPGPDLYVAQEIENNHFKIAGGKPGGKVSWQVTGIRQDPYANAHRIPVEENKPANEKGYYLHPELYGQPQSMSIGSSMADPQNAEQISTPGGK